MKDLFSSTTSAAPRGHTEIVEAIKRIEVVDCDLFHALVGRAISDYFSDRHSLYENVPARTKAFARAVSDGITQAVEYFSQEEEPELSLEDTVKFEPLRLRTNIDGGDKQLDTALTGILTSMDEVTHYQADNRNTFMFRIALPDGSHESLVPEITRFEQKSPHRPEQLVNVMYDLNFAAFED
jgi:hypothetical protein